MAKISIMAPVEFTFEMTAEEAARITIDDVHDMCRGLMLEVEDNWLSINGVIERRDARMSVVCTAWDDDFSLQDVDGEFEGIENRTYSDL
jgi:regulation of enolase protein 1 (concanavalin A-like superfamily)